METDPPPQYNGDGYIMATDLQDGDGRLCTGSTQRLFTLTRQRLQNPAPACPRSVYAVLYVYSFAEIRAGYL
eukprot:2617758-Rhodomonas_salina.1